jgi:hypothetical protein
MADGSQVLGFSASDELRDAIDFAASRDHDTRASWIRRTLLARLRETGFLDENDEAQLPPVPTKGKR